MARSTSCWVGAWGQQKDWQAEFLGQGHFLRQDLLIDGQGRGMDAVQLLQQVAGGQAGIEAASQGDPGQGHVALAEGAKERKDGA